MDYRLFEKIVIAHRNHLILIGILILLFIILGIFVIEFYVREELGCRFFTIGKLKFSPTWIMVVLLVVALIIFSVKVHQCNKDILENAYTEYTGEIEYSESSVKFLDIDRTIFVGKGHEIVPEGLSYGKVVYAKYSMVIVYYSQIESNSN